LEASASDARNVVAPESSTLLGNCSDTTSHLITKSHVESGQSPQIKYAVLYSASPATFGRRYQWRDIKERIVGETCDRQTQPASDGRSPLLRDALRH
jgi:hypothetical protein